MSDRASSDLFLFYAEGVILTSVATFGLVGTLMSIYVLVQPKLRNCFSTFLTGLAVCDSAFLFFAILMFGLPSLSTWFGTQVAFLHLIPFSHGAIHVARMGSVYITMSVTLERFFVVVYPLKKFRIRKFLLPIVAALSLLYNLPKFFELETYVFSFTNETAIRQTTLRLHPVYEQYYTFWSKMVVMEFVPYTTLIVLNAVIVWKIAKSRNFRRNFSGTVRGGNSRASKIVTRQSSRALATTANNNEDAVAGPAGSDISGLNGAGGADNAISSTQTSAASPPAMAGVVPREHEISLAITLVTISVLFIVCQSLKIITDVYELLFCEKIETQAGRFVCKSTPFFDVVISLANLSSCVNSAANFLVYMLRGKKFRDLFLDTYCCCRTRRRGSRDHLSRYSRTSVVGRGQRVTYVFRATPAAANDAVRGATRLTPMGRRDGRVNENQP